MSRKRIFEVFEKAAVTDEVSIAYDLAMIIVIVISLVPLAFWTAKTNSLIPAPRQKER